MQESHTRSSWGGVSLITWSESMCVGIALLDEDHETIIRLNMRLQDGLERQESITTLAEICARLVAYNKAHFTREEMIMGACAYPDQESHRDEHRCFIQGLSAFMERYAAGPDRIVLREFLSYLREWVDQHVLIEDARMGAYAARHRRAHEIAATLGKLDPS
jgi:hemerythrin